MSFHMKAMIFKKRFWCFALLFLLASQAFAEAKESLSTQIQSEAQSIRSDTAKKPLIQNTTTKQGSTISAQGPHASTAPVAVTTTNATLSLQKKAEKYTFSSQGTNSTLFPTANGTEQLFNRAPSNLPQMAPLSGWE